MYQKLPPKGMRDFLPAEKAHREHVAAIIKRCYTDAGFTEIETSPIENLGNLIGGDGGENTKLIFKILKRGEKLENVAKDLADGDSGEAVSENDLADLGLRFDFTLPLSRFYSNNRNELPNVAKLMQIGMVFRGERPQKGRFRGFVQCDIDIIGDETPLAEIEVLRAASNAVSAVGIDDFEIHISDRRFLLSLIEKAGVPDNLADEACIALDKYDKIGADGVAKELEKLGVKTDLISIIQNIDIEGIKEYSEPAYENIKLIIGALGAGVNIKFDPTLVRGMSYYTATIFEIYSPKYSSAIGGGGRYDKMIGKISGSDAPAVGFSIGFERLCDLLESEGSMAESEEKKTAIFVSEPSEYKKALEFAAKTDGVTSIYNRKKKFGKQIDNLRKEGFTDFYDITKGDYLD